MPLVRTIRLAALDPIHALTAREALVDVDWVIDDCNETDVVDVASIIAESVAGGTLPICVGELSREFMEL